MLEEIPSIVYVSPDEFENQNMIAELREQSRSLFKGKIHFAIENASFNNSATGTANL